MKSRLLIRMGVVLILCLGVQACGGIPKAGVPQPVAVASDTPNQPASTVEPTIAPPPASTDIQHLTDPGSPSYIESQKAYDCITGESYVAGAPLKVNEDCDMWNIDYVERPFTADLNTFLPYLDIQNAQFGANKDWIYARIIPYQITPQVGSGNLYYGLEIDLNRDGFSDYFIAVENLPLDNLLWTVTGVRAWRYESGNVNIVFDQGAGSDPDLIWACRSPKSIEIAFKPALIGTMRFVWWAWTFQGELDPNQFIPTDSFAADTYQVDDTCAIGFNLAANITNTCGFIR